MLLLAGFVHVTEWIIALARATFYVPDATQVFGDLRTWGWIQLLVGLVQFTASVAIFAAQQWGRWLGVGIAVLSVLAQLFFVNAAPWWAMVVIGIDILIIYALTRYGVGAFE
jgi:hypothetical protein